MRDLAFVAFLATLLAFGFKRPFLFVLAYVYVDIVSPQRLSYYLLNAVPISLICVGLAVGGWLLADDKRGTRLALRQCLMILLLGWAFYTTLNADFPIEALDKWGWVWKALAFAIFLPFTLRTRARIEGLLLFMVLSVSSIVVVGGVKTLASGGGYGALNLMVANNSGLYEGSIISTFAVAVIPLILFLAKYGTVFPADWRVRGYAAALIFACLLIPVGTEARTGLVCIAVLAVLMLRATKRRFLYVTLMAVAGVAAVQLLPDSYGKRMETIQGYQGDSSASTRLAVWKWTWGYVKDHPAGGGFNAYMQNRLTIDLKSTTGDANSQTTTNFKDYDAGRAYHSSYFEMLGEQGFPGFIMWISLHLLGLIRMEAVRRRWRRATDGDEWIAPLATALQHAHLIYMVGSLFVGIAFQTFILMMVGCEIGFDGYLRRRAARTGQQAHGFSGKAPATTQQT
ncbi:putative O-glycosylation ligase, exosortase A system-associated [Sphingomonas solaris]|uniref:Putative O-glycosylation ligase, exosortase A system-associated n=1 Tax=Alterirhizorhabdus solaris TaxID=2529389 RepID=A0A558R7I5_9SPHN|nr:putative O-glycosylation ligase, exosortase A system-associated [Sphingomonas solaris]TVV75359.1 putative O-glycosylation ligase, exosortase A system-associated [Sphingomonas solaris]